MRTIARCSSEAGSRRSEGFYVGQAGIALAWLHAARDASDAEAMDEACRLIDDLVAGGLSDIGNDMLSGWSGTICAALELHRASGSAALVELARAAGEAILAKRVETRSGTSWRTVNKVGEYNLTGFSHGTAGIAHALLLLFEETRAAAVMRSRTSCRTSSLPRSARETVIL